MIEKAGDREGMNVGKDFTEHGEGTCGLVSGNGIVSAENTATAGIYETLIFNYLRRENANLVSFFCETRAENKALFAPLFEYWKANQIAKSAAIRRFQRGADGQKAN